MAILSLYLLSILSFTVYGEFTCIDNRCVCSDGECIKTCSEKECINYIFICTDTASECLIHCNGLESCEHSTFVLAASESVEINCNGTSSCDRASITCGVPDTIPDEINDEFDRDDFDGSMRECIISAISSDAMHNADIICKGSISNCIIDAYSTNSVQESFIDCNTDRIDGIGCQLNCIHEASCGEIEFDCYSTLCSCGLLDTTCQFQTNVKFQQYLSQQES
eukprot:73441_1